MGAALVAENCQPGWIGKNGMMLFNRRNAAGHWDAFYGMPGGQSTPILPAWKGHRGVSGVTPDGRYAVLEVDFGAIPGLPWAEPGRGTSNDLELLDRQTGRLTRLTTGRKGTIWAKIKPDGSKVCWSEMLADADGVESLGSWAVHVADVTSKGLLANELAWRNSADPTGFYETYGWASIPGLEDHVMFCSDAGVKPKGSPPWLSAQCWMVQEALEAKRAPLQVSQPVPSGWPGQPPSLAYHEFMHVAPPGMFPGGPWILTSVGYETAGVDLWRIKADGSGMARVTYFNGGGPKGWPKASYTVVGGLAFDPADPKAIYAGVTHDIFASTIDCWKIEVA